MSQATPTAAPEPQIGEAELHAALAAIARAIADSLEVREVWDRVFEACKTIVPFDALGIVRFEPGGTHVRPLAQAGADLTVLTEVPDGDRRRALAAPAARARPALGWRLRVDQARRRRPIGDGEHTRAIVATSRLLAGAQKRCRS